MKNLYPILCATLLSLSACDSKDIRHTMKAAAESIVSTQGFAEKTIQANDFSSVSVNCFADVTYHQIQAGEPPRIVLKAPEGVLPHLLAETNNEELNLQAESRYHMPRNTVIVADIHAPAVSRFCLNGGKCLRLGTVSLSCPLTVEINGIGAVTADSVTASDLYIELNGSGSADLRGISTGRLHSTLNGSGHIYLAGQCGSTSIRTNGTGNTDTTALQTIR